MSSGASADADARFMALALSLGRRGMGRVWPNPAVGCVIVKDGRVIGRGWTQDGGRPHAEPMALAQAGDAARGADVYVTLEPCAHTGKTPPCCDALIAAGVARVICAMTDPDPRVAGQGLERLKAAGIATRNGVMEDMAAKDHRGFLSRVAGSRPMVTLKLATTLDGRIATAGGESKWITGPQARRMVHAMRARHDAVLVGAGTARADLPSLTVRDMGHTRQPVRVVLSRDLTLPQHGPLFETAGQPPVWLVHGPNPDKAAQKAWAGAGATLIALPDLTASAALQALGARGLTRVFCEGGAGLAASMMAEGCVDQLVVFNAGLALGADGLPALQALPKAPLADIRRFTLSQARAIGPDTVQIWDRPGTA